MLDHCTSVVHATDEYSRGGSASGRTRTLRNSARTATSSRRSWAPREVSCRVAGDESGPQQNTFEIADGRASFDKEERSATEGPSTAS